MMTLGLERLLIMHFYQLIGIALLLTLPSTAGSGIGTGYKPTKETLNDLHEKLLSSESSQDIRK